MKKFTIFGREIEWYDVKTKFKKLLRGLLYSWLLQELICLIILFYMWFVYVTSQKKFVNSENFLKVIKDGKPVILSCWHNRLMMIPFLARHAIIKVNNDYRFMTLASHHGDGQFVGRVMKKFLFQNIYGSSNNGRKASRGIELTALREIVRGLKSGKGLGITPDGPRGPNQQINSEVVSIARISDSLIIPVSYSCSRFKQFNSWDKFKLPLPFSKLCFYCGEILSTDALLTKEDEALFKIKLQKDLDDVQNKADEEVRF